ncbi:MAG: class I SAM-dependent rRNA methyltransferase [Clostridia bacterium]|nr:class I SAM-dependent rRNA methyltransferase [Clostridia bacterium]
MARTRNFVKITVTPKAEKSLRGGHPWVYFDEITNISGKYQNGDLVDVFSAKDRFLGTGFINDNSKIRIRIISRNANDRFDRDFYMRRVKYALDYRRTVMGDDFKCCRLIFGEADSFPGLTADRFENVLVVQILSLAMERIKDMLFELLLEVMSGYGEKIDVIYERNDVAIRQLEGMEQYKGFYKAPGLLDSADGHVIIRENGIQYDVDYINGQKTGFFLDQKYNRAAVARISKDKTVLDCFTHTGAFALNCAKGGAKQVTAVDISQAAIDMTRANAQRNGLEGNMSFECANVFELLTDLAGKGGHPYDFIILDPPAFTKSRSTVKSAERGYKEINLKAMKLLPRGGYLATCSCSHFMPDELFRKMLHSAAADAQVTLRQIECRQQSPDHPIVWNIPETDYLKFYIFQVI